LINRRNEIMLFVVAREEFPSLGILLAIMLTVIPIFDGVQK